MEKLQAKQILESRSVINKPGKYSVNVTNVTYGHQRKNKDGSYTTVDIVNFAAMTSYQSEQAIQAYKEGDYEKATNNSLSTSRLDGQFVPVKGERVDIEVEQIWSENQQANILVVSQIIPRQAQTASKFKLTEEEVSEEQPLVEAEEI